MGHSLNDLAWRFLKGKVVYFLDYFIVPPIVAALLVWNAHLFGWQHTSTIVLAFIGGFLFWTLAEYIIHRWLFHHIWPLKPLHDLHHEHPEDLYGAPSCIAPLLIFALILAPLYQWHLSWAWAATAGVMAGYYAYIGFHYLEHARPDFLKRTLARARRRHMLHHYADPNKNYGVSTSLWDHVFGTEFKGRSRTNSGNGPVSPASQS